MNAHAQGARELKEAVSANSSLNQLALVMTGVSEELQDEIEDLVAARREQRAQALGASRAGSSQDSTQGAVSAST